MSHTLGPWKVSLYWAQETGDCYVIDDQSADEKIMEADRRLIEAAPDLLAACKTAAAFLARAAKSSGSLLMYEDVDLHNRLVELIRKVESEVPLPDTKG